MDELTGEVFARTELAPEELPDSFGPSTRLDLRGEPWDVLRADPPTAAEFVAAGSLVLTLRRVQVAAPEVMKYSLPTFFDPLPPGEPTTGAGEHFVIHEDDWRRTELVSRGLVAEVEADLRAIRQIYERHLRLAGTSAPIRVFDRVHIRQAPTTP